MKLPNFNLTILNTERKTTRFMWVALLVLVAVSSMIAFKQDYFVRNTAIYFFAPNAQGISKGMAVKFIGFKVGSVQEISMQSNASVKVKLSLDNEYVRLIGQDAKARLTKEALVGEGVVEIIPGEQQVRQVVENSVLVFERGIDAGALVERLTGQLQPILTDVKQITSSINNPRGDVQQILKNLTQVTGGLRETVVQFNALAQSGNQKLDGAYVKVDRALDRVNSSLEAVDKAIPKLVGKADATMDNVQSVAVDIKRITSESSEQIPSLVRNTNALVQDSQETLKGVQKSWLLNDLFPRPEETALPVDGYVTPPVVKP
ncbi:MAG: MlaD family protein [Sideroxydans sp.]|nr:MlaD family protein [Sideroxydans sp.]